MSFIKKLFFGDEKCKFPKGRMQVQTALPFYEPGNTIEGLMYLEILE